MEMFTTPEAAATCATSSCGRETKSLTWNRNKSSGLESRVPEGVFVEDISDLHVLHRRREDVRLERRGVLVRRTVAVPLRSH